MIKVFVFLSLLFSAFISAAQSKKVNVSSDAIVTQVKTAEGIVQGTPGKSGIVSFKGIPYAAPPVGSLRWKAPQAMQPWTGIRKCNSFGPSPMQPDPEPFYMWSEEFLIPKDKPISEDCLYLNVWTGSKSPKEKRPVLVWIYGGGFNSGGGSVPIYDGEAMAGKGIVFVSVNYRVGIFGFFAHPELTKESQAKASGNYGFLDQIAALKWVKKNISNFGGDPENITIAGQSAGSMSVVFLVASPLSKGLFQKAIAQSGAGLLSRMPGGTGLPSLHEAETEGTRISGELNATSAVELKKIPAEELRKVPFRPLPIIDGYVMPENLSAIFRKGKENEVVLLTGWNEEEGIVMGPPKKAADFRQNVEREFGSQAPKLLEYYPASNDSEAVLSEQRLQRDVVFGAQNYTLANIQSSNGKRVYVYRFTRKVPGTGEYAKFGAFHTGEVPYAYDNLRFVNRPWEPVDHQLAETMSAFWINFITSGDPNGKGLPEWPVYEKSSKKIMEFGDRSQAKTLPDAESLDFLSEILEVR